MSALPFFYATDAGMFNVKIRKRYICMKNRLFFLFYFLASPLQNNYQRI